MAAPSSSCIQPRSPVDWTFPRRATAGDPPRSPAILTVAACTLLLLQGGPAVPSRADTEARGPAVDSMFVLRSANQGEDFLAPMGIAIDRAHREIVVANTGRHRVEFFDLDAYPLGWFTAQVPGPDGRLVDGTPRNVAVDTEGNILVTDLQVPWVAVVDYRGRPITRLALPAPDDTADGQHGAGALAVAPDGAILVASRGEQGRIHVFDRDYRYVSTWGTPGRAPGQLATATAIAFAPRGEVVVTCYATDLAVQVFDLSGNYLRGFGVHDIGPGNFSLPSGVTVTADGRIWVLDALRENVQVFDSSGSLLGVVGGGGSNPGEFKTPSALASDGSGLLAVTEQSGRRLQLLWVR